MMPFIFYLICTMQFLVWNFTRKEWFRGGKEEEILFFVLFGLNLVLALHLILTEYI